jgi:hypothetical protein
MIVQNIKPNWFYKPIEVENLLGIQEELTAYLYKKIPNFDTIGSMFVYIDRKEIEPHVPLYKKYIDSLGILAKWEYSAIVGTTSNQDFVIHVDCHDWILRSYGLNIPIINCDGTYTVWYDAEIEGEIFNNADPRSTARMIKPNTTATEIARWEANKPAWVNNSIPHRPISTHTKPRAIISARFTPEVHDLFYK